MTTKLEAMRARRREAGGTMVVRHGKQPKRYIGMREDEWDALLSVAEAAVEEQLAVDELLSLNQHPKHDNAALRELDRDEVWARIRAAADKRRAAIAPLLADAEGEG